MTIEEVHALLITRFTDDARLLRERASSPGSAGPSAQRSREMADACSEIVNLATGTPSTVDALDALGRAFDARAGSAPAATQAVWRGAALRTRELLTLLEA
jgi:hypothetical protein